MISDLHMTFYEKSCEKKRVTWAAMIGNVTLQKAMDATPEEYRAMIGPHAHSGCRKFFWALVKAASVDDTKKAILLSKSNSNVSDCFNRVNHMNKILGL
jgi:hypothetical protein